MKFARTHRQASRAASSTSASRTPSTAAPWARSPPPGPRSTASPSSRWCPGSASCPGTTSRRWTRRGPRRPPAVMIEPVQGEGGVRPATPEFLQGLRSSPASGRAPRLRRGAVRPRAHGKDVRVRARGDRPRHPDPGQAPRRAGCPWARCSCATSSPGASHVGDHGSTFGGNPVAAAAALAVLDRLTSPVSRGESRDAGRRSMRGLKKLARRPPARSRRCAGLGLMVGVEFKSEAGPVVKGLARAWLPGDQGGRQGAAPAAAPRGQVGGDQGVPRGPRRGPRRRRGWAPMRTQRLESTEDSVKKTITEGAAAR